MPGTNLRAVGAGACGWECMRAVCGSGVGAMRMKQVAAPSSRMHALPHAIRMQQRGMWLVWRGAGP